VSGKATLAVKNLPSHTHTVTAEGTISSTFTGKAVTSGNNSVTPTASFTGTKGTTSSNGAHTHDFSTGGQAIVVNATSMANGIPNSTGFQYAANAGWWSSQIKNTGTVVSNGDHTHTLTPSGTVSLSNTTHTHNVTAKGTVSLSNTDHTHSVTAKGTVSLSDTTHTHSVTAKGTVSSTFTGTEVTSSATGSGTAFSTQDAYVVVYIWKRTK
jgi:hypothetical protein